MATNPKIKPCPKCKSDQAMGVYSYENGGRHVECDDCHYLGPCSGSVRGAIILHNKNEIKPSADESADRHADLGRLMEACGVYNDGIAAPAVLFERCLAKVRAFKSNTARAMPR